MAVGGVVGGRWWEARQQAGAGASAQARAAAPSAEGPVERKVLYYRNPMGLPDTSPTPKKDPMGMDYIPVYAGEDAEAATAPAGQVRMSADKVQKLGVRVEPAAMRPLARLVRASGRVEPDERRVYTVTAKFEGYVERLHVNASGQPVARGQALFEVYSPELVSAQREYAIAVQGMRALSGAGSDAAAGMQQLAESSLARLRNWDIPAEQVDALARSGEVRRTVTYRSPVAGIVTEKKAVQGMRFMPGEMLYQVTDLGAVWVIADVFEQDIAAMRPGARAMVRINAYPERTFPGTVTYVYPTMKAETRTVPVRIELANPGQLLKPAMFAQVELAAGDARPVLTVPDSAVIDSGTRSVVLVQVGEGRFDPREVRLGARGDAYVQVLEGVRAGEQVVVAANFLIDAESNLKAAVHSLGGHQGHGTPALGAASSAAAAGTAAPATAAPAGHKGQGTVDAFDARAGTISLEHGPIATLKWPAMTMEFKLAHDGLLRGVKPGEKVDFEFVERGKGEWVITAITPAAAAGHVHR
ncbi:efflux RND transporter periplasmic adaptor subunit [Ramlibacter alkalitolerans]|uniref:Efflux RND transporter periplasmic adaptor subunit n=2 Tax=Ramlibacter alkalitolerans TaxID=2039631 RepID=A0ABS1JK09_9BURK|nr:efflux RND transporter periplasmic adaptor subunit [Ramlibacter alkalitolerans]MBL0424261.1 efflux RND transporter periplasmic adaptor subunit [Ramlibacter alkalitolerans]